METENKLIAEFMGLTVVSGKVLHTVPDKPTELLRAMQYHTSWDWLMPVVEKINSLGYFVMITPYQSGISCPKSKKPRYTSYNNDGNILHNTYKTVCNFINWYNEQQLTQITNP